MQKTCRAPSLLGIRAAAFSEIRDILSSTTFGTSCAQCTAGLVVAINLTLMAPWEVPPLLIELCNAVQFRGAYVVIRHDPTADQIAAFGSCEAEFSASSDGQIATQVLAKATSLDWMVRSVVIKGGGLC